MQVEVLTGAALEAALDDVAGLRMAVFREWPYLYDGDLEYEAHYLRSYRDNPRAILVVARDRGRIVGAATGMPLADHGDAAQMSGPVPPVDQIFYCAESVLLAEYRGQRLGHAFFDRREAFARDAGFAYCAFCGVIRPDDHPLKPAHYRPLASFWHKRGYRPVESAFAQFRWTDLGDDHETAKTLQVWMRRLEGEMT